eukprot:TRINITY_DN2389_c0_g1_i22.p1 TRINITY_DN2389_c0_g1~~TRINITY_DN2389_c0_g1_i22.p1  ORF type:complete len:363 (-),score=67.53 TRINITY_DN2389_c0_g1_i22:564-1652(-)
MDHDLGDFLVQLRTPFLEGFLKRYPDTKRALDLTITYHINTNNVDMTTRLLVYKAQQNGQTLQDRQLSLSQAIRYSKESPVCQSVSDSLSRALKETEIQLEVYKELESMDPIQFEDVLEQLNTTYFSLQSIYTNFAIPYKLNQSTLLILKYTESNNTALVQDLWKKIIDLYSQGKDPLTNLKTNLHHLGKKHLDSPATWPLNFLLEILEDKSVVLLSSSRQPPPTGLSRFWVCDLMLGIGIPFFRLFMSYNNLLNKKEGNKIHLIIVLVQLIYKWQEYIMSSKNQGTIEKKAYLEAHVEQSINKSKIFLQNSATPALNLVPPAEILECETLLKDVQSRDTTLHPPTSLLLSKSSFYYNLEGY